MLAGMGRFRGIRSVSCEDLAISLQGLGRLKHPVLSPGRAMFRRLGALYVFATLQGLLLVFGVSTPGADNLMGSSLRTYKVVGVARGFGIITLLVRDEDVVVEKRAHTHTHRHTFPGRQLRLRFVGTSGMPGTQCKSNCWPHSAL